MNGYEDFSERFEKKEANLQDIWAVLRRRKWTIAAFALPMLAIVTIYSFAARPTYTAKGTLLIEKEPNILSFEDIFQIEPFNQDYYQTQYKLLESRALADSTIERLKLYEDEKLLGKRNEEEVVDESDTVFRSKLVDAFLGRLKVNPIRNTRLVEVRFKHHDPQFGADVVNALFESFIDMRIEMKYKATEQATAFLEDQIMSLRSEIEAQEKEFQEYGAEKNIIALSDKETTIVEKLAELNKALTAAQIDRIGKETYYNEIKVASADYIPDALSNPLIQRLREEFVRLKREYIKKQETFLPEYPEMQRLKAELESAKQSLETETNALIKGAYSDYQASLKRERSLQAVFDRQKKQAIELKSNAILYNSLKIEIENKKSLLESLIRRQSETGVSARLKGLRTANVRVVDRAVPPLYPSSPRKKLNIVLALLMGLFGGVGLAFFFEYLDNSVKNFEDVKKATGLPGLGLVPAFSTDGFSRGYGYGKKGRKGKSVKIKLGGEKGQKGGLLDMSSTPGEEEGENQETGSIELITSIFPRSTFSEYYRSIRTTLLLSTPDGNMKSIIVCSPLSQEGKTTTLCNLAVTFAQTDKTVVIVDSDLRKPKIHKIFKIKNLNGLTNYLTGDVAVEDLIKESQTPNLYLINAGPIPPNPVELLGSEKMSRFIGEASASFDYVFFDSPPLLAVSDALVMGPRVDGVLLTVWGGKTTRDALKRAKEKLDLHKIKTIGVVINNINLREHDYYYMRQYYKYYGEG
ncbi:MAG: polysaccharide biosynthesis tyrosine autokinase [Deltaproteobacteria bacterium]|nr:polysaccharide biosynthesis tyrosine autokinase [Deltaproteobacteria bacterium]